MAQKTFSKHSEYKTYSAKGNFDDKGFDSMKAELLPARYGSLVQPNNGTPGSNKEFYYEYKEEKNPAGTFDRKDLHTVEQYEFNTPGDSGYHYNGTLPLNSPPRISNTTTTVTKTTNRDLSHNIEELDSLLDDLQKDQERKLYKGGYTSDVMESSSFDYKPSTPLKSSGYSSISRVERDVVPSPPTVSREVNREVIRNYVTESHVVPSHVSPVAPQSVPAVVCVNCQGHSNTGTPMNKVTTTVKTYTYEVPADQDPTTVPIPGTTPPNTNVSEKYLTTDRNYIQENHEHRTYANTHFNTSTPVKQPPPPSPQPGCQYCSHCNSCITTTKTTSVAGSPLVQHHHPLPHGNDSTKITTRTTHYTTSAGYPDNRGPSHPNDHSPTYAIPVDNTLRSNDPPDQRNGPTVYKYTTTNYTTYNTTDGPGKPAPFPAGNLSPPTSPSPFPRTESPAPRTQEPPKRLDDLMADFPGHENYRTDHDGLRMRPNPARGPGGSINGNLAVKETAKVQTQSSKGQEMVATPSKNVEGPAVYYPPGHELFQRREESAAYQQAGGGYMKAKGKYQYEAESRSKSKSSSSTSKDVVCLPLCCAMPCVLL